MMEWKTALTLSSLQHFLQILQNLALPMKNSYCDDRNFDRVNQPLFKLTARNTSSNPAPDNEFFVVLCSIKIV